MEGVEQGIFQQPTFRLEISSAAEADFGFPGNESGRRGGIQGEHSFCRMGNISSNSNQVDPFIRRLAPSGGLQKLVVRGLKHEDTLKKLRTGLVKDGGSFLIENSL